MLKRVLRWGLLGTARINRSIIPPLRASERNQLTAVASRSLAQAQAYAAEWNIPRVFGSYAEMLADPEIDVVYIPLPNHLHAEWTIRAAQAGKHVLCEKPLALSVEQVDAVVEAARRHGVVVAEAFMYRHHPVMLKLKELVEGGTIGALRIVRGSFTYTQSRERDVRLEPEFGGGSIWDVGCYPISLARFVVGSEPVEIFGWQTIGPTGVDVAFVGQMRFASDVFAQVDCGFRAPYRTMVEVVGSDGTLHLARSFKIDPAVPLLLTRGDRTETVAAPEHMLYLGEVEDMADAILLGKLPRISLADSRANVAALVACLQSAREGRPVALG